MGWKLTVRCVRDTRASRTMMKSLASRALSKLRAVKIILLTSTAPKRPARYRAYLNLQAGKYKSHEIGIPR
jgi:hypothetical protein